MRNVFTAQTPAEAHVVAGLLEEVGIDCVVEGEMLTGARMGLPMDDSTLPGVFVRDEDVPRAVALIAERHPARTAPGAAARDEDLAEEHPGLVWFKRLLLAMMVLGIAGTFVVAVREFGSWTGRAPIPPGPGVLLTSNAVALVAACGIACLAVPRRRVSQ